VKSEEARGSKFTPGYIRYFVASTHAMNNFSASTWTSVNGASSKVSCRKWPRPRTLGLSLVLARRANKQSSHGADAERYERSDALTLVIVCLHCSVKRRLVCPLYNLDFVTLSLCGAIPFLFDRCGFHALPHLGKSSELMRLEPRCRCWSQRGNSVNVLP
jgi:hypothetical protein